MRGAWIFLFTCVACGSSKTFPDDGGSPDDAGDSGFVDMDATIKPSDAQNTMDAMCNGIKIQIATQQSCAMTILQGFTMDGEGFITVNNVKERVFAMDRYGMGHIIGWCDSTTMPQLLQSFDVRGYLGQKQSAKVASFGDNFLCNPAMYTQLPMWMEYQGQDLPAKYKGNAALLAQDWDAIVFCGFRIPWATDWTSEIDAFVSQYGKGFLGAMDYEGVVMMNDFTNMTKITKAAGIQFDPLNLPWSPATLNASLDCVPDVPPPPK